MSALNLPKTLPSNVSSHPVTSDFCKKAPIRIIPSTGGTDITAGGTAVFSFPQAKVLQLSSFRLNFQAETTATSSAVAGFPKYIACLISQMEIFCNGVSVQNITNYNQIYKIMRDFSSDNSKFTSKLNNNSDPSSQTVMANTGVITRYNTYANTGVENVNQFKRMYCIDDWIGFFDAEKMPDGGDVLNTNAVGSFEVHITFAPDSVLWNNGVTSPTYKIKNLTGWIDSLEYTGDTYITALEAKLTAGNHLMPFKNYRWYQGTDTTNSAVTTIRVTENTVSLDKLIFTYLDKDRATQDLLRLGDQSKIIGASGTEAQLLTDMTAINNADSVPKSTFCYEYLKSIKNPYLLNSSRFFRRNGTGLGYDATRTKTALIQFEVDSQDMHNPMDVNTAYEETLKAFELNRDNLHKTDVGIQEMETYLRDFFVCAYSLSHLGEKKGNYLVSGIDTIATAVNVAVKVTENGGIANHANQGATPVLITEFTSVLQIGSGRAIKVW